jgi:uncharacterized protein YjhX (UPF0386 family)
LLLFAAKLIRLVALALVSPLGAKKRGHMGSNGGLEGLQKRLRAFHDSYEAGQKSDSVERRAMRQSLGAVIDFLMTQPSWCAADSALLLQLAEALADLERGHATSWLSNRPPHPAPIPINIRRHQAQAAAHMEQLMRRGLSREEAARKVFREMLRHNSLFEIKENASWRTVVRWLDEIRASPRNRLERKAFEEALRQSVFDFSD